MLSGRCGMLAATLMPILAILICRVPLESLGNFTDAVFYLSYARQFSELVLRYGFLYYATRFGGIMPDAISGYLFGEIDGIWILRWVLSAVGSLSLFLAFRKRYGVLAGLLASALWSFNPAALRLACTTYVDSTAVPFLIIGCCLVSFGAEGVANRARGLTAGVLFGMASSAHLYAAFSLVLLVPFFVGMCWGQWRKWLPFLGWSLTGFFIPWAIAWLWYTVVWGMPALLSPTIDLMRDLGNGQAAQWKKPTILALHETPAWFAPIALLPVCGMAAWKGSYEMRGAACALFISSGFFWGGDLFGKAYVLSMPFYYSFLLPVTVLAAGTVCGEVVVRQTSGAARLAAAGLMALPFMLPTLLERWKIAGWVVAAMAVATSLTVILIRRKFAAAWLVVVSLPLLFLASLAVALTGMFSQMLGHYATEDAPVLELAWRLRGLVPSAWSDQETTRFWYEDDPAKPGGSDRRMIGAFWLHYFGKLTGANDGYVPFGMIPVADVEVLRDNGPGRIVIFDQDSGNIEVALRSIKASGLPYRVVRDETIGNPGPLSGKLRAVILERSVSIPGGEPTARVTWRPMHRGKLVSNSLVEREFCSGSIKWWDSFAEADLGTLNKGDKIVIPYRVLKGRVRFSLRERGGESLVSVEKWPSDKTSRLMLVIPSDMKDAVISLHNKYPNGSASGIRVEEVGIFGNTANP